MFCAAAMAAARAASTWAVVALDVGMRLEASGSLRWLLVGGGGDFSLVVL